MEYYVIYPSLSVTRGMVIPNGPTAPTPQLRIEATQNKHDAEELKKIRQKNSPPESVHIIQGSFIV